MEAPEAADGPGDDERQHHQNHTGGIFPNSSSKANAFCIVWHGQGKRVDLVSHSRWPVQRMATLVAKQARVLGKADGVLHQDQVPTTAAHLVSC